MTVGRETKDPAFRQTEREDWSGYTEDLDDELESAYEDRQNGDYQENELSGNSGELDDDEFCLQCGEVLDCAGDGYAGLCPSCADLAEEAREAAVAEILIEAAVIQRAKDAKLEVRKRMRASFDFNPIEQGLYDDDPNPFHGNYSEM